jgi:flagellar transcriptional activator FlhD
MTGSNTNLVEIRALNLAYLQFARANLEKNRHRGEQLLGVSAEVAQAILKMTDAQQVKLASGAQLLCAFQMTDYVLLSGLAEKVSRLDLARLTAQAEAREALAA